MALLQPNTARNRMFFLGPGLTGASVTISKNAGSFGAPAGSLSAVGTDGWFNLALTTGDTDTPGDLAYFFTATVGTPNQYPNPDEVAAPVLLANGVAHGGTLGSSTATLALSQILVSSQTPNEPTVRLIGSGIASVILVEPDAGASSADTVGVDIRAGGDGSTALRILHAGSIGAAVQIATTDGNALTIEAEAATLPGAVGVQINGDGQGPSVVIGNGGNGAEGIKILAGVQGDSGDVAGILVLGAGAGSAVQFGDGSTGGIGLQILSGLDTYAVEISGIDHGIRLLSGNDGLHVEAGANGMSIAGGGGRDIILAGDGLLQGDIGGRILGNTSTAFVGIGVRARIGVGIF